VDLETLTDKCRLSNATYTDLNKLSDTLSLAEEFKLPLNYLSESKDVREMLQNSVNNVSSLLLDIKIKHSCIKYISNNFNSEYTLHTVKIFGLHFWISRVYSLKKSGCIDPNFTYRPYKSGSIPPNFLGIRRDWPKSWPKNFNGAAMRNKSFCF